MRARFISLAAGFVARFGFSRLVGSAVGVTATALGAWWVVRVPPPPVESTIPMAAQTSIVVGPLGAVGDGTLPMSLTVHVAGEVVIPGVYELEPGARMVDAIDAAGGPTRHADTDAINLATPLSDAEQVFVPRKGAPPRKVPGRPSPSQQATGTINLNTASTSELESLPGVGPQTAKAIVDHRTKNGPFLAVDELLDVAGIGPAKLAALRERVRV
jgi:competence protein ComEA